jgi:hypothetical protein
MEGNDLILLCYASAATRQFNKQDIVNLLLQSRAKNARLGVSGMLLYVAPSFFQILEGERAVVASLYDTIVRDQRHGDVLKLIEEPIEKRAFADWTMGYADVSRSELSAIPGLNDFFASGGTFNGIGPGRAKILLEAFRGGRWRQHLSRP